MYAQERFLWSLPLILNRKGCAVNEDYCFFPDLTDPDPEYHFSGVKVGVMDSEVVMTFEELLTFVRQACAKFVELHPEYKTQVEHLVDKEN